MPALPWPGQTASEILYGEGASMSTEPERISLATFQFGEQTIRVAGTKEAPIFCAADVCAALELGNPTMAVANHPEDEKGLSSFETLGGAQKLVSVTEPGLYRLIFRSYKPKAEEFRRWVFREVLPALRHTGNYAMPGRGGEAMDLEGRVTTFIRVTEALVKLGAKPVVAGNAALRWLPVITAGQLLPGCEDKEREEMERLFARIVEREEAEVLVVEMGVLLEVAREHGLLQELRRGGERGHRVRMGMCLRKMRGEVIETARGAWELRQRHGARMSEWVLRRRSVEAA